MRRLTIKLTPGGRFSFLLLALMIFLVAHPFLDEAGPFHPLLRVLFSLLLLSSVWAISSRRWALLLTGCVVLPAFVIHWASYLAPSTPLVVLDGSLGAAVFALTGGTILYAVFRDRRVSLETIAGALCVYLLLGLMWSFFYGLLEVARPGAFQFIHSKAPPPMEFLLGDPCFSQLVYYSYCTLTTLGLGDITPVSGPARTFSYMEAVAGQMYLAVLVARLVGLHISQSSQLEGPRG